MLINATSTAMSIMAIQNAFKALTVLQLTTHLYPEQANVFDGATFDYIIVGAGTTGCVIASRLVEDNKTKVLLIEAGDDPQLESGFPSLMLYMKQSAATWNYKTEDDGITKLCHKPMKDDMSIGKLLGGSSSLSYLLYNSGNHYDYDKWAEVVNDTTWNWKNVLPYFKKSQKLEDPIINNSIDGKFFGKSGKILLNVVRSDMRENYMQIFKEMGNDIVNSINGNNSLGYTDAIFTTGDNIRQSTAESYLVPMKHHPNLYVLKNTIVKKIIFDAFKNAVGVEAYTYDDRYIVINSRKEIIVSAGTVNSPKLLMLSGIGPKNHLNNHKIATISDLPVGENLQNHLAVIMAFNMTKLIVPFKPWNPRIYTTMVLVGYVSLNKSSDYPDYQSINFVNYPSYLMPYCTFTYGYIDSICDNMLASNLNSPVMYSIINKQNYKSRGRILLKSNDYRDDPLIYTNYYSVEEDLEDNAKIVEDFIKIVDTEQFKKIGGEFKDPKIKCCEGLTKGSREYWKCYVKCMMTSQRHYTSTCAMGSVVDSRLRVYGVRRLRVADASIMPHPTAGGTLGAAIMIGEKVSDMIKADNKDFGTILR